MNNYKDFQSANEEERQWVENYNNLSKYHQANAPKPTRK